MRHLNPQAMEGELHRPLEVAVTDLPELHHDAMSAYICRMLSKSGLICFRLSEISPDALFGIASIVGELTDEHSLEASLEDATRDALHLLADPIWRPASPDIALMAVGNGAEGRGGLIAASRVAAHEALSPAMRCYLAGMEACHDASLPLAAVCETPEQLRWLAALREKYPPRTNALLWTLDDGGKVALGISPAFTAALHGAPPEEGRAVLDYLKAQFEAPECQRRIEWEDGLVVVWNPRVTLLHPFGAEQLSFSVSYAALKRRHATS